MKPTSRVSWLQGEEDGEGPQQLEMRGRETDGPVLERKVEGDLPGDPTNQLDARGDTTKRVWCQQNTALCRLCRMRVGAPAVLA